MGGGGGPLSRFIKLLPLGSSRGACGSCCFSRLPRAQDLVWDLGCRHLGGAGPVTLTSLAVDGPSRRPPPRPSPWEAGCPSLLQPSSQIPLMSSRPGP